MKRIIIIFPTQFLQARDLGVFQLSGFCLRSFVKLHLRYWPELQSSEDLTEAGKSASMYLTHITGTFKQTVGRTPQFLITQTSPYCCLNVLIILRIASLRAGDTGECKVEVTIIFTTLSLKTHPNISAAFCWIKKVSSIQCEWGQHKGLNPRKTVTGASSGLVLCSFSRAAKQNTTDQETYTAESYFLTALGARKSEIRIPVELVSCGSFTCIVADYLLNVCSHDLPLVPVEGESKRTREQEWELKRSLLSL